MSFTYSGDPSASPIEEVRFLSGDTDGAKMIASDEEIEYLLSFNGKFEAAALVADKAAAFYGAKSSKTVGSLTISYTEQKDAASARAASLRERAKRPSRLRAPILGGGGPTYLGPSDSGAVAVNE